jgi:hypothetical protein
MALTIDIKNDYFYPQGEKRKALEIAGQLLRKGLEKNLIAETTGLTLPEIEKIENEQ